MLRKIISKGRIILVALSIACLLIAIAMMLSPGGGLVGGGTADLSAIEFIQNKSISLDGQWEFYWNKLLTSEDFRSGVTPQMDSFMKVPGSWAGADYPRHGVATYRIVLRSPSTLKDTALRIQNVASAYKLYANGQLIAETGTLSENPADFKEGEKIVIAELPKETQDIELIFHVGNMNYASGGIRESPVFGSKHVLEKNDSILMAIQLLFIGSVFIFGIHYFLLFILRRADKTALLFSILCVITALRSAIWGEVPMTTFFPNVPYDVVAYINYYTGYNLIPSMLLFILSVYPLAHKRRALWFVLLPSLLFDVLLLFKSPAFISTFTNYAYLIVLLQMAYMIGVMMKAVIDKRDNAILMFFAICVFVLAINEDILHYKALGGINLSYAFLFGSFIVILAMSFVQAKQHASNHQKLILFNENLVEADRLKDKIMATEMSLLQAQIKPHFLYNALDAIANVCEENGEKASDLIVDLSMYLRESLEFNSLDKLVRIEKELEFVRTYFNIEQARFGQKIQLIEEIKVSLDMQIPMLILQPLVENAVRHGISKKPEGGTVYLRMQQTNEGISLEIRDDGVGIQEEMLALLLDEDRKETGVGLLNIHHRLLKLYGRGLTITSKAGSSTCVNLVIPEGRKQS